MVRARSPSLAEWPAAEPSRAARRPFVAGKVRPASRSGQSVRTRNSAGDFGEVAVSNCRVGQACRANWQAAIVNQSGADGSFEVETETADGRRRTYLARKTIIATGYYDLPNALGIPGEDLPKVSHYALEGHAFFQRKVAVIGGANSAAVTSLDLWRHGADVTIVYRRPELSRHI